MQISKKIVSILSLLPDSSSVAVVTLVGSLCPVTIAHVQCIIEANKVVTMINGDTPPLGEQYDAVVGFISVNSDSYVNRKLAANGEQAISATDRRSLVDLATTDYDWIASHENAWRAVEDVKSLYPELRFHHFEVDGADAALKSRIWRDQRLWRKPDYYRIVIGRPGVTQKMLDIVGAENFPDGKVLIGQELTDVSATDVREALRVRGKEEISFLTEYLHPEVLDWLLRHGPYHVQQHRADTGQECHEKEHIIEPVPS